MQRIYDNETPPPDPELCNICGKCWSTEEGYILPDGRMVCRACWEKQQENTE